MWWSLCTTTFKKDKEGYKRVEKWDRLYFWSGGAAYFEPKLLLQTRRKDEYNIIAIG